MRISITAFRDRKLPGLAMRDLLRFLNEREGCVAVLDGTNSTKSRRQRFKRFLEDNMKEKYYLFMVESVCNDPNIIEENVTKVKVHNPDFEGMKPEEASREFFKRIEHYNRFYEMLDNTEGIDFMKTINIGQEVKVFTKRSSTSTRSEDISRKK
jgi:6-phosphofructo-2-kinase/fructose-2,6-biphosphatase 2